MTIRARTAGALSNARRIGIVSAGGFKPAASVKIMTGNTLVTAALFSTAPGGGSAPLSLTVDPGEAYGFKSGVKPEVVTTNAVSATPAGGAAPYAYSWVRVSGDARISAINSALATTAFRSSVSGASQSAVFRCTVTSMDSTASASAFVSFEVD